MSTYKEIGTIVLYACILCVSVVMISLDYYKISLQQSEVHFSSREFLLILCSIAAELSAQMMLRKTMEALSPSSPILSIMVRSSLEELAR